MLPQALHFARMLVALWAAQWIFPHCNGHELAHANPGSGVLVAKNTIYGKGVLHQDE